MGKEKKKMDKDFEELWERVGLENLRQALTKVDALTHRFERSLQELPNCDKCARVTLLDHIEQTGAQLSGEIISLTSLAASIKQAVNVIESAQKDLKEQVPHRCECPDEAACTCH